MCSDKTNLSLHTIHNVNRKKLSYQDDVLFWTKASKVLLHMNAGLILTVDSYRDLSEEGIVRI